MFNKIELLGAGISIMCMVTALYLLQTNTTLSLQADNSAQLAQLSQESVVVVGQGENVTNERAAALKKAASSNGKLKNMVIDDVKIGSGEEVKVGDVVEVHYVGTLQNGQEFDNSRKRGEAFSFPVGAGQVIAGWDQGVVGMKKGGQRILVIPPEMAYGKNGIGPIPGDATLVFAIELIAIK